MGMQHLNWEGPLPVTRVVTLLKQSFFGMTARMRVTPEALRAEVIRIALWEQSVFGQSRTIAEAAISTHHILSRARILIQPFSDALSSDVNEESEDHLGRRSLDDLANQGDLLSFSEGRWLPAPLRLVLITADLYLLVGGMPSALLADPILQQLHLHGSFRQLETRVIQSYPTSDGLNSPWKFQSQESWLNESAVSLTDVFQRFQVVPVSNVTIQDTSQNVEVYIASRDTYQALRWCSPVDVRQDGRYLLRSCNLWGQRSYSIGEFEQFQLKRQSQNQGAFDIRRLCYALDAAAGVPTRVKWNKQQERLKLFSELPAYEYKRLSMLGTMQTNQGGKYYPRIWHIASQYENSVKEILSNLCITIQ